MSGYNKRKQHFQRFADTPDDIAAKENIRSSLSNKTAGIDDEVESKRKLLNTFEADMETDRKIIEKYKKTKFKKIKDNPNSFNLRALIITISFVMLFVIANPGIQTHQDAFKNFAFSESQEMLTKYLKDIGLDESSSIECSQLLTPDNLNEYVPIIISRRSFVIFSQTVLRWKGLKKVVGVGVLGNIFLFRDFQGILCKVFNKQTNPKSETDFFLKENQQPITQKFIPIGMESKSESEIAKEEELRSEKLKHKSIELYDLIKLFAPDKSMDYNAYDWKQGADEDSPIAWQTSGVTSSYKDDYPDCRIGDVVVSIKGHIFKCLEKNVVPCEWRLVLFGAHAGYTCYEISSCNHQELPSGADLSMFFNKNDFKSKLLKSTGDLSSGTNLWYVKIPNKKPIWIKHDWSCGSGGCSVTMICYTDEYEINTDDFEK